MSDTRRVTIGSQSNKLWHSEAIFTDAVNSGVNQWINGCGGREVPFQSRSGKWLLYCYNPALKMHAYLDVDNDLILTDDEARTALQA